MNNLPKLFISIDDLEIFLIVGHNDDKKNFKILEKLILPIYSIDENKTLNLNKVAENIKKNILIIERKVNYTFKDIIVIINNFDISFLNFCGFKKLNGTQVSKENITYILNSLKSCIDKFEKNKKILHIFNSEYRLDKKKLDNLPIGLFGDFYSHELSFNLINKNDFKNLENIFNQCNLKIEKLLLESFVKGSLINNTYPNIETFIYIQIENKKSKIFYVENNAIKNEQKFDFGTDIILNDICKIISLNLETVKKIIKKNKNLTKISSSQLLENEYFDIKNYRKIKKNLISEIAEARIKELSELIFIKNINFRNSMTNIKKIFLEISDKQQVDCFNDLFRNCFSIDGKIDLDITKKVEPEELLETAYLITQFGWKKEAIPITNSPKSLISRIFRVLFN